MYPWQQQTHCSVFLCILVSEILWRYVIFNQVRFSHGRVSQNLFKINNYCFRLWGWKNVQLENVSLWRDVFNIIGLKISSMKQSNEKKQTQWRNLIAASMEQRLYMHTVLIKVILPASRRCGNISSSWTSFRQLFLFAVSSYEIQIKHISQY